MTQIFPKPQFYSHVTISEDVNGKSLYPINNNALGEIPNLILPKDQKVLVLDELIGPNCEWCKVLLVDSPQYGPAEVYLKTEDLVPIDNKIFMQADSASELNINLDFPVIEWPLKEAYIPFIDKRNGSYCVSIETEYENIISKEHLLIMAKKAYSEGIQLLLRSKGFEASDLILKQMNDKYYSFGRVEEFFVDTRKCMPVKLLVTFPLRFLSKNNLTKQTKTNTNTNAKYELKINSKLFEYKVDRLLSVFNYYADDISDFLNPNGVITSFVREYELMLISKFVSTLLEMLNIGEVPLSTLINADYVFGFDDNLILQYVYQIKDNKKTFIEDGIVNSYRFRSPFDSKRTINYFLNLDSIVREYTSLELKPFFDKYVKYPIAEFKKIDIKVGDLNIPSGEATRIKQELDKAAKQCFVFSPSKIIQNAQAASRSFQAIAELKGQNEIEASARTRENDEEEVKYGETAWNATKKSFGIASFHDLDTPLIKTFKTIRSLVSIVNRFNLPQFLLDYLVCTLKKGDNLNFTQNIPIEIIQILNYLILVAQSERDLNPRDAETLLSFIQLSACAEKEQEGLLLIMKVLSATQLASNGIKDIANSSLKFSSRAIPNTTNLMRNITTAVVTTVFNLLVEFLKGVLQQLLEDACADGPENLPLDASGKRNPLKSSASNIAADKSLNQNSQNLDSDRKQSLQDAGVLGDKDPELYLDLLKSLIDDISCVLTPQEICSLVLGRPEPETLIMVRTIIRKKYLPELNELLQESQLRILFKELGKRIDKDICEEISQIPVANKNIPSLFCSPQQLDARKKLLADKMPEDLLNEQLKNYNKRKADQANSALDLLKNNLTKKLDIPYFCGDGKEGLVNPLNDWGRTTAKQQIDSMFSGLYTEFNNEATDWPTVVTFKRYEEEDGISKEIKEVSYNLKKNLESDNNFAISNNNYSLTVRNKFIDESAIEKISKVDESSIGGSEAKEQLIENIKSQVDAPFSTINYDGTNVTISNLLSGETNVYKFNNNYDINKTLDKAIDVFEKDKLAIENNYKDYFVGYQAISMLLSTFSDSYFTKFRKIEEDTIKATLKSNKTDIINLLINNVDRNKAIRQTVLSSKYFSKDMKYAKKQYLNKDDDPDELEVHDYKKKTKYWTISGFDTTIPRRGPWKLINFQDGMPYFQNFKISRDPTAKEKACGIDTHYLNLHNIKKKIMKDYEDGICEEPVGAQDGGRTKLSAFEKANLVSAITLIFRIYLADYLSRSIAVFINSPVKSLLNDDFFIQFYRDEMNKDIKAFNADLFIRFEKYLNEIYQEGLDKNLLDNRFISIDPYEYFFKKEIHYASNKFKRALDFYGLSRGEGTLEMEFKDFEQDINNLSLYVEEFIQLREIEYSKAVYYTALTVASTTIAALTVAVFFTVMANPVLAVFEIAAIAAIGYYINYLTSNEGKKEYINLPYASYGDLKTLGNYNFKPNTRAYCGARIISNKNGQKIILHEEMFDTGYIFREFISEDREDRELDGYRKSLRNKVLNSEILKESADFLYSDGLFAKLLIPYSYFASKMLFNENTGYTGSKTEILSLFDSLTGDKNPLIDESAAEQTAIDAAISALVRSRNPNILLAQNPELAKFGAKEIITTLIRTPIDIVMSYAEVAEPNIALSKRVADIVHLVSSIGWIFVNEDEKQRLYTKSPFPFKFFRDSEPVLRPFMVSPFLFPWIFPMNVLVYGVYIGVDIYDFTSYVAKILGEKSDPLQSAEQIGSVSQGLEISGCSDTEREKLEQIAEGEL